MKWIIPGAMVAVLAGCGWNTAEVVEYKSVSVAPIVRTTTVVADDGYYGNYDYYNAGFGSYDYNFDYDYDDSPVDVTTTTVEIY